MAYITHRDYREACDGLISQIYLIKFRLEAKYGPSIKSKWAGRTVNGQRQTDAERIHAEVARQESAAL